MSVFKKPIVSVLIPAYNHEAWVEEAILSVINQTYGYENIELIVADDYSKDNTAKVLSELASKYQFKLVIHKQNKGLNSTINELISLSSGKYIASFASDDKLILNRIENQILILESNPDIDILAGEAILIDEFGKIITTRSKTNNTEFTFYNFDDFFMRLKPGFAAGTAMIKSDLFKRIGTYDSNYLIEDYYFWLKATYNQAIIAKCNLPFLYYRLQKKSLSSNTNLMDDGRAKILTLYKTHPKYSQAMQNYEITKLSKLIFNNRIKVVQHLLKNPNLFLNRKTFKVLAMLIIPKLILKKRFPENFYRHATL